MPLLDSGGVEKEFMKFGPDTDVVIFSDKTGIGSGPTLILQRNNPSAQNGGAGSQIVLRAMNNAQEPVDQVLIKSVTSSVIDGAEESQVTIQRLIAGTPTTVFSLGPEGPLIDGIASIEADWTGNGEESLTDYLTNLEGTIGSGTVPNDSVITIPGTTHTLDDTEKARNNVVLVVDNSNQACAITMPDASTVGAWLIRSKTTGTVTIQRQTSGTINGGTSVAMAGLGREGVLRVIAAPGGIPEAVFEGESTETTIADGDHDHNGKELYGAISPFQTATGSQASAASARSWKITGNLTAVPITAGWWARYWNKSGSGKTLKTASGNIYRPDGSTVLGTTGVTIANGTRCVVHADGTDLSVDGPGIS
jgi:hypothetical protein